MKPFLLVSLSLLLLTPAVFGQKESTTTVSGYIHGENYDPITEGTLVEIISGSDTLRAVSGTFGAFTFRNVKLGEATIRVLHMSYKPYVRKIEVKKNGIPLEIGLQLAVKEIKEVTVKADIPLYRMSGDTLIYNAAAVKTLEGDDAIKILEQLPGIVVGENSLTAMGKDVARTYVDGKLIFGEDPMAALLNLTAADVQKIKIYDEYSEADRRFKRKAAKKRRVLDIQTRSKLISATTGHFLASYGTDFARDNKGKLQDRYGAGLTANFFSEKLRLSANAYTNNVNRSSNRLTDLLNIKNVSAPYAENTYAAVGYEQMFGDEKGVSPELSADYSYKNTYTRSESYSMRDYFPTSDYASRTYYDSMYRVQRSETHFAKIAFKRKEFMLIQSFNTSLDKADGMQRSLSVLDEVRSVANTDSRTRLRKYEYNANTGWYGQVSEHMLLRLQATAKIGKGDGSEWRTDTLSTRPLMQEYNSSAIGRIRNFTGGILLNYYFGEEESNFSISGGYDIEYNYEKSRRLRYDLTQGGALDIPGSRDLTYDYVTHKPTLGTLLTLGSHSVSVDVPFNISLLNQDMRYPGSYSDRRRFVAFVPEVHYSWNWGISSINLNYSGVQGLPAMEQLSGRVDDSTPLYPSAGNPTLKQTYTHSIELTGNIFTPKGRMLILVARAEFVRNGIVDRSTFYKDGATLPAYDNYRVPAGGTFTTYENVNGGASGFVSGLYNTRIKPLKLKLVLGLQGSYDRTPTFVGERKNITNTYSPGASVSLTSNFSKQVRISVLSRNTFIYAKNSVSDDNRYFRETAGCIFESNFAKRLFFNANYEYTLYKPIGGSGVRDDRNMLNVVAGCKFHKNMGAVSISCYDLLNKSTAFKTSMFSDYVRSGWTPTFGRYWTVNISYRFNKTKSGAKPSQVRMDDGAEASKLLF